MCLASDGLSKGSDDDNHELDTVYLGGERLINYGWRGIDEGLTHSFTTDDIREPTKEQLTDKVAYGGCDFYAEVLVSVELLGVAAVDVAQHCGRDVDGEDIVAGRWCQTGERRVKGE